MRRKKSRLLKLLREQLRKLNSREALEPGQREVRERAWRRVERGWQMRDWDEVEAGVTQLARSFLQDD